MTLAISIQAEPHTSSHLPTPTVSAKF